MLMKKFSKVIVALVTILVLGLVATGCSCSNSNKNNTNSTDGVVVAPTSTNDGGNIMFLMQIYIMYLWMMVMEVMTLWVKY